MEVNYAEKDEISFEFLNWNRFPSRRHNEQGISANLIFHASRALGVDRKGPINIENLSEWERVGNNYFYNQSPNLVGISNGLWNSIWYADDDTSNSRVRGGGMAWLEIHKINFFSKEMGNWNLNLLKYPWRNLRVSSSHSACALSFAYTIFSLKLNLQRINAQLPEIIKT